MKALFVAKLDLKETEGIYKKVCAQAEAIGQVLGECELVTRKGVNAYVRKSGDVYGAISSEHFFDYIKHQLESNEIKCVYIRHMIPNVKLIQILKLAHRNGIKIYYEIPTYPYFAEQFKVSRRKHRAIVKIALDVIFWPFIYKWIDKLVIIKSNTKVKMYSKMIEITNGVRVEDIKSKNYNVERDENGFRMVAVGTLYPYHGYDRILKGLANCQEKIGNTIVEFHVVGMSETTDELRQMAEQLGLKHVAFHGIKTTEELNGMYDSFDVGLGCLALHRRDADVDTTLKIVEYYCRGVPVVTSGISPMDKSHPAFTIHVPDNEEAIDIKTIYDEWMRIDQDIKKDISIQAKSVFAWEQIMSRLLEGKDYDFN